MLIVDRLCFDFNHTFKPSGSNNIGMILKTTNAFSTTSTIKLKICNNGGDKYRFGFNGQEKTNEIAGIGNHNTAEFWEYDTRLARRWNIDPNKITGLSQYAAFANNPVYFTDVLGDTTYTFNGNTGAYMGMTDLDKVGQRGMLTIYKGVKNVYFNFADPINDPSDIRKGKRTSVYLVSDKDIEDEMNRSGASNPENQGLIQGARYLRNHSNKDDNDGLTDFTYRATIHKGWTKLDPEKLYITNLRGALTAHNFQNFGNYLWGAAANRLGISLSNARQAAHINNWLNDPNNQGLPLLFRKWDSPDDQRSISQGWEKSNVIDGNTKSKEENKNNKQEKRDRKKDKKEGGVRDEYKRISNKSIGNL